MRAHSLLLFFPALLSTLLLFSCAGAKQRVEMRNGTLSFYYSDPRARMVYFASSMDRFTYHPAQLVGHGVWQVTVPSQRQFTYFYIVDGNVTLPDCQQTVADDFGSRNCLFVADM